jgi:quinol monooxygenase YgiN
MPIISQNNDLVTVIVIFSVESQQQQKLVDNLVEFVEKTVKYQPGFVSASIHTSLDGTRVMNYAQWKSQQDYEAFINNTEVQSQGRNLAQFPKPDIHIYEVAVSFPEDSTLIIANGTLIHLAEFRIKPENQQRLVDLERENGAIALENPGLISFHFHRSTDGIRTINYGQWRSVADFEQLLEPKYAVLREYWQGLAENEFHLYEVTFTEPRN